MAQQDFLWQLAEKIIDLSGLGPLTEEQQRQYIPSLVSLLEERIGLELMPQLSDEQEKQFTMLATNDETSPEAWRDFWYQAVPNFEEQVMKIVGDFIALGRSIA